MFFAKIAADIRVGHISNRRRCRAVGTNAVCAWLNALLRGGADGAHGLPRRKHSLPWAGFVQAARTWLSTAAAGTDNSA